MANLNERGLQNRRGMGCGCRGRQGGMGQHGNGCAQRRGGMERRGSGRGFRHGAGRCCFAGRPEDHDSLVAERETLQARLVEVDQLLARC